MVRKYFLQQLGLLIMVSIIMVLQIYWATKCR